MITGLVLLSRFDIEVLDLLRARDSFLADPLPLSRSLEESLFRTLMGLLNPAASASLFLEEDPASSR